MKCRMCPRRCGADRENGERGVCGAGRGIAVARVMLHPWEEPCLTARGAAGAVFFSGCPLGCVYCQNRAISRPRPDGSLAGETWDEERLAGAFLSLQAAGAGCIDLVSPTQYARQILAALGAVKARLTIPVVWNTGGYETPETVAACAGLVDIFLTDMKYGTAEPAARYSRAPDYPRAALAALAEMVRQTGAPVWDGDALVRGVIVRHLILPGGRHDSEAALAAAARTVAPETVILSLMRQYTPDFAPPEEKALRRRVTTFEYECVREAALRLGFSGYGQEASSARAQYTPDFPGENSVN